MNRRVLLIDGDSGFRDTLTRQLGRYRVVVMTEADPERGLALLAADPPDLIVISVEEPEKQGFKTFQKARKSVAAKLPIMLVTSTLPPESFSKHRGMKVHADEYVDKRGLEDAALVAAVDGLLGLGEPDAEDELPYGEDIPMELGDGDVVLDEQLEDDDVGSFANDQKNDMATVNPNSEVLVDSMVAQETDAAFDALLGDDMFGGGSDPVAPEPAATEVLPPDDNMDATPEPIETAPEPIEDSAIPEPVPHKIPDSDPDLDSVPAPIRDGGHETGDELERYSKSAEAPEVRAPSQHEDDFVEEEAAPIESMTAIPIADDDMVSLDDELPVEVEDQAEPEPAPYPEAAPRPMAALQIEEEDHAERTVIARPPEPPAAVPEARSKTPTGSQPNAAPSLPPAVDLGLDSVADNVEAEREQSGVYDHKGIRKIGELERQIAQLKSELDRSRATTDTAAKGNREAQFLNLREQNLTREKELKDAKRTVEQNAKELAEVTEKWRQAQHAKDKLEAQNAKLEQQIFEGKERELQETLDALALKLTGVERELEAKAKAAQTAQALVAQLERDLATERATATASASEAEQTLRADRERLIERHKAELAALKAEAQASHDGAISRLREELEAAHAGKLDETIEELRRANAQEHTEAVEALETTHASTLTQVKSELGTQLAQLEARLSVASQAHVAAVAGAEQQGALATAELEAKHEDELAQAAHAAAEREARHQAELAQAAHVAAELVVKHQAELGQAARAAAEREAALEAKLDHAARTHKAELETASRSTAERDAAHQAELEQVRAKYEAEIEARDEEATEARDRDAESHGQALAQLKAQLDHATASHEVKVAAAQREVQDLGVHHEAAKANLAAQHEAMLAEQRAKHEADIGQLSDSAKRTAETHRAALAEQQQKYEAQIVDISDGAQREIAEQRGLVHAAKKAAEDAAARHQAEREHMQQAHATALGELEAKQERAVAVIHGEALKAKSISDAEHAKEIAALKAEVDRKARDLEETHARAVGDLMAEREELKKGLSGARDSLKRSEGELASAVQTIADRNADLRAHAAAIAERDQRIGELRAEIESIEAENANYQEQVLRAYQKIKTDEAMVAKARKAMAIALTVLDDQSNPATTKSET